MCVRTRCVRMRVCVRTILNCLVSGTGINSMQHTTKRRLTRNGREDWRKKERSNERERGGGEGGGRK